jgi:hypothetical protein
MVKEKWLEIELQKAVGVARNPLVKDGGHVILECSACNAKLVDLWVTKPTLNVETSFVAICCYCGDKSFATIVKGGVHIGGYAHPDWPDVPITKFKNVEIKGEVAYVETEKAASGS